MEIENDKITISVRKALLKVFDLSDNPFKEIPKDTDLSVLSDNSVSVITTKSGYAKKILLPFSNIEKNKENNEIYTKVTYSQHETKGKYLLNLLQTALSILKATKENDISITTGKNTPISVENKHFRILIAPLLESD